MRSVHWRAELDGGSLPIYNHEDLIALYLPAGTHSVKIGYSIIAIQWLGLAVSFVFLGLLVIAAVRFRYLAEMFHQMINRLKHIARGISE